MFISTLSEIAYWQFRESYTVAGIAVKRERKVTISYLYMSFQRVHTFAIGAYRKHSRTFDGPDADETLHQETLCTVCGYSKNTPVYKRSPLVICKDCVELAAEAVRVSGVPSESDSDDDILTKIVELDAAFADRLPRPEGGLFVQRLSKSQLSQFRSEEKFDKSWSEYFTVEEIDHRLEELATLDFLY